MKKLYFIILLFSCSSIFAQKVLKLFNEKNFDEIVKLEKENENLSGEETYYLGYAFFRKENDVKAIEYYDKALKKGFDNPTLYFQKGLSQMYLKDYDNSLKNFDIAINVAPLAEFYFEKIRIYSIKDDLVNQEKTILEALQKSSEKNEWYVKIVLFGGGFYYNKKDFSKSETIYKNAIADLPKEYKLYSKLIKSLNGQNKFSEANIYFEKVRSFYEKKELPEDEMKFKNLTVDQFAWKNKTVNIHKYFEQPKEMLAPLYVLYLIDEKGEKVERKFKIEKTIQIEKTDPEFVICEETQDGHSTYPIGFMNDTFTLTDLKEQITNILDKENNDASSAKKK